MLDTIAALATAPGRSALGIIRISGTRVRFALETLAGRVPAARVASLCRIRQPESGALLDEGLVLFFEGPASATGEDVGEFHLHGSPAVLSGVLSALTSLEGVRLAEPGEFTRRALLNGVVDLFQAEAINDLVHSETSGQRALALKRLGGSASTRVENWRERLIEALAYITADLDFSDEDDVPDTVSAGVRHAIDSVAEEMAHELGQHSGERMRDGVRVVLAGAPNVGKSSLLNALARRDVAIVSDLPGTTRDVLEVRLDCDGVPMILSDVAGLRDTGDAIEKIGVERALARLKEADLILLLDDGRASLPSFSGRAQIVRLHTKCDLLDSATKQALVCDGSILLVSTVTGEGMDQLEALLAQRARLLVSDEAALITQERHRLALQEAHGFLIRTRLDSLGLEMMADDVRAALHVLARLVGAVDLDDILDVVFSHFCIGK